MTRKLVKKTEAGLSAKDIKVYKNPDEMKALLNKTRWKILHLLARQPMFPAEIARVMELHEQKIYYHINKLVEADLIKVAYEKEIRGAKARYYTTTEKAFGIELEPNNYDVILDAKIETNEKIWEFFEEFSKNNHFDGLIVVGSPEAHGPHKTWARDGHYAIYLAMFLGKYIPPTDNLYVKLDVEVRSEKKLDNNLILVGGPAVNLVTRDINSKMSFPAFDNHIQGIAPDARFGQGIPSQKDDIFYSQNNIGIIFKTPNPFNEKKTVIAFAGQGRRGTKAAILALVHKGNEILKDYSGGSFRKIVEGYDLDGDGRIDSVEILE